MAQHCQELGRGSPQAVVGPAIQYVATERVSPIQTSLMRGFCTSRIGMTADRHAAGRAQHVVLYAGSLRPTLENGRRLGGVRKERWTGW